MSSGVEFTHAPIDFGELDWEDGTFAVLPHSSDNRLEESLERFGILQPPWVLERAGEKPVIVDGFKRLRSLSRRGYSSATCLVFPIGSDTRQIWLRRIEGKFFGPPLNLAEKAQLAARLAMLPDMDGTCAALLSRLGISSKSDSLAKWVRLASAGDLLLSAASAEEVCERAAMELLEWDEGARQKMIALLRDLRCSASIQVEIIERVREIAQRDGKLKVEAMNDPDFEAIVCDPRTNHREKTRDLRAYLDRRRFPRLAAKTVRFGERLALLRLPGAIRLIPPPSFEGERWMLQISFSNPAELLGLLDEVQSRAASDSLSKLMDPAK